MNDDRLARYLQSVGKACFVRHFEVFADERLSISEAAAYLKKIEGFTDNACRSRVGHSRMIIKSGRARDAMAIIATSRIEDSELAAKARRLSYAMA